jgi:hypothetical protein
MANLPMFNIHREKLILTDNPASVWNAVGVGQLNINCYNLFLEQPLILNTLNKHDIL